MSCLYSLWFLAPCLGTVDDAVHLLQVKPPLVLIVGLSVSKKIVELDRKTSCYPGVAHGPVYSSVEGRVRLIPGANLDACAAT